MKMSMKKNEYDEQSMVILSLNPRFKSHVSQLRKKWDIPENGFVDTITEQAWSLKLLESPENEIFNTDFDEIFREFDLNTHFKNRIHEYLFYNTVNDLPQTENENVRFFSKRDKVNLGKERFFLEIYAGTTLEDIRSIWSFIKQTQKNATGYKDGRRKPSNKKVFDRDTYILELSKQGMSGKEIIRLLKENMPTIKNIYVDDITRIIAKKKRKSENL